MWVLRGRQALRLDRLRSQALVHTVAGSATCGCRFSRAWWQGRQHLRLGLGELERADQPGAPDAVHAPRQAVVDDSQGGGAKGRRASDGHEAARQLHAGLVRGERDGGLIEGAHEDGDEE